MAYKMVERFSNGEPVRRYTFCLIFYFLIRLIRALAFNEEALTIILFEI